MALSIGELVGYVDLDTSGVEKGAGEVEGILGGASSKWGKLLGGAGMAVGAAFATSLVTAMNLEPGSDRVAAALGGTSKDAERFGEIAGDVYSNGFGAGMDDVNAAIEGVVTSIKGMRDASARDVQDMTERAMTFADVMQVDVSRAAQVAGTMIHAGLAKNGEQAFDLLMRASQKVPQALREDVLDATEEYGQFFTQLGIDGPTAMDILAEGAEKGMYGIDKAGDAVKEFTIRSTDMSTASKDAYEAIGLNAGKMADDILAGGDRAAEATGKILDGLLELPAGAEQANAAIALFGTPLEDLSTKDIPKFLDSLKGSEDGLGRWRGSVQKAGETAYDNASTNLTMFGRTLKTQFVDMIGGKVLPALTDFSGWLVEKLGPTIKKVREFFTRDFSGMSGDTAKYLGDIKATARDFVSIVKSLWRRFGADIVEWARNAWRNVRQIIGGLLKVISGLVQTFAALLKGDWKGAWAGVKKTTSGAKDVIVGLVKNLLNTVKTLFRVGWNAAKGIVGGVWGGIKTLVSNGAGKVVDLIRGIPGKISALGGRFAAAGRGLLQGFIDGMKNAAGVISGIAGNVWDAVRGLLNGAIGKINAALEFTIDLPGPKNLTINPPNIPQLATGGRVSSGTLAVIGEGREAETVLPDSLLRGLLERVHESGRQSAMASGSQAPLIGAVHQQPGESVDTLAERLYFKLRTRG